MNLAQIIEINDKGTSGILTELLYKYKKSLFTYYSNYFNCEPILMVTDVFNAAQYAIIVPANEFHEAINHYLDADNSLTDEEKESSIELISYQSIPLSKF